MFRPVLSSALRVGSLARLTNNNNINIMSNAAVGMRSFSGSVHTGTVKWFDPKKGFGFITPDDGTSEVFVHQTSIHADGFRSLAEGEPVEYSVTTDGSGKMKAENVTGPMGAYVQGAPRRAPRFENGGGYGGGGRGGGGGYGRGRGSGGYGDAQEKY